MTTLATTTLSDPRRKNVHALLDPRRFDPAIDYYGVIYDSALLATRLMGNPQALQHDYCFFFGKNAPANAPVNYKLRRFINQPCYYACDKAVGELDQTDIRYVEQQRKVLAKRVVFSIADLGVTTVGECHPQDPVEGVRGCKSVIYLSRSFCTQILAPGQSQDDIIRVKFALALTLLHELAHAAHHHLFGGTAFENFRENSLVSEAGFEYESRLFGQRPEFRLQHANPDYRIMWGIWQSRLGLGSYNVDKSARNAWQLPRDPQRWTNIDFVVKLFNDGFWEGDTSEYAVYGALALIPGQVAFSCISGEKDTMSKSIPLSIKDLFRGGGPSYAKKRYARFANPERKLRGPVEYDRCGNAIL